MPQAEEIEDKQVSTVDPNEGRVQERPQLEVDLSEDDDGDEGAEQEAKGEGRRAKRTRRFSEIKGELAKEREARQTMERELAEIRGRLSSVQQPREVQREVESDPYEPQINALEDQQQALLVQLRDERIPESRVADLQAKFRQLEKQKRKLEYKQAAEGEGGQTAPVRHDIENQMLATEFPDVFQDQVKLQEAKAELAKLCRDRRQQPHYGLAKLAAKAVQDRYTRKVPAPSANDKAKFAAEPGRAGAGGNSGKFSPNKSQLSAARAFTAHIEDIGDEERVRIWAKKVGKPRGLI